MEPGAASGRPRSYADDARFEEVRQAHSTREAAEQGWDALATAIRRKKVNWVLDADIRDYFGSISHEWLGKFVEHRIGDRRVVRLIQKWLKAGVLEDGLKTWSDKGTPQGATSGRGEGKPETFDFLGFTHICSKSRKGRFQLLRRTIAKRLRAKLREVNVELKRRRHQPVPVQGAWLAPGDGQFSAHHPGCCVQIAPR